MGHSVAEVTLTAAEAERATRDRPGLAWPTYRNKHFRPGLVDAAVRKWRDEEASRYDDERPGDGRLLPIMSPALARRFLDSETGRDIARADSAVIPIAAAADVVASTRTADVALSQGQLTQLARSEGRRIEYGELLGTLAEGVAGAVWAEVAKLPRPAAPVAKATEGRMETRYEVVVPNRGLPLHHNGIPPYTTLSDARQAALEIVRANPAIASARVEAHAVRVNADDDRTRTLLEVSRPQREIRAKARVGVETVKPGAVPESWLVAFDYHH